MDPLYLVEFEFTRQAFLFVKREDAEDAVRGLQGWQYVVRRIPAEAS